MLPQRPAASAIDSHSQALQVAAASDFLDGICMVTSLPTWIMPADDQSNCAVYAQDGLGNDISSSVAYATSNPTCSPAFAGDVRCPLCAAQYMQQGLCLPGRCAIYAQHHVVIV